MDHLVSEAVEYYHEERPHQAMNDDVLLARNESDDSGTKSDDGRMLIACRERLDGFLKHDYAKAA